MYKKCATPGCTLNDFHAGAHSHELVEREKKRKACVLSVDTVTITDACGFGGYGGM